MKKNYDRYIFEIYFVRISKKRKRKKKTHVLLFISLNFQQLNSSNYFHFLSLFKFPKSSEFFDFFKFKIFRTSQPPPLPPPASLFILLVQRPLVFGRSPVADFWIVPNWWRRGNTPSILHPLHPLDLHRTNARTPSCTVIIPFCSTISTVSGSLASSGEVNGNWERSVSSYRVSVSS